MPIISVIDKQTNQVDRQIIATVEDEAPDWGFFVQTDLGYKWDPATSTVVRDNTVRIPKVTMETI